MFLMSDQTLIFVLSIALLLVFISGWFIFGLLVTKKGSNNKEEITDDTLIEENALIVDEDNDSDNFIENTESEEATITDEANESLIIEKDSLEDNNDFSSLEGSEVVEDEIALFESKVNDEIIIEDSETNDGIADEESNVELEEPSTDSIDLDNVEVSTEKDISEEPILNEEAKENNIQKHIVVPTKKGRTYNGKYEIFQVADGYAYCLKASNGEVLVTSETYISREGVIKAIDAVKRNLETGEVRIFADKRGKYKFKLVSKNYRVLAISSTYSVEKSAVRASESFKKFALKADIVDIEVLDNDFESATIIEIINDEDKKGGRFVIEKFDGEYSWDLKASNGQILCQAEGYTSKAGCMYSIETFKKNVKLGVFKCIKDKSSRYCYKLYTPNGRVIAIGESYPTKASAEAAANSVVAFYNLAEIEEIK